SGYSKLVVPCDINKDGYPDVYLTGRPTPTTYGFLYLNNGNGTFTDITTAADVQCANVSGAVFGDVDNDGNTDLYISSGNGDHLFHNQGDETFTDITGVSGVSDVSSDEAIFGDVDNDGDLDLLVMKHQPPRTILFMNNGDGTFTNETNAHGLNALNSGEYVNCPRFVDLDNDGDLDLLVDHSSFLIMYQNDGSGFFTPTTLSTLYRIDPPWFLPSFSVSDIDNDGDLDIIVRDYESKITFLLQNDDHSFTVRTDLIFGRLLMYYPPFLFAEIDNNPGEDLLSVRGNWGEPSQAILIRNSKTGLFKNYEYLPVNRDCSSLIPCVLDIDRDGDNDIIYGNYLYLEPLIKVLKNQVNDQNWLDVQPVGRICNRDAIGTKVYIYSSQNELIGFQEVSSQRPVPLHFGLGGTEGPYDVVIQWPASEITDVLQQVSPAQLMTVTEGSTLSSLFVNAGRPYVAILGDPIHFRGVALGEEPYTWHWDFGDNSISDSQNPYHNYTQTGVYTVTLTVTDSLGMIANDTTTATITPLIADAHGPYTGTTGQSISFTGTVTGGKRPYTWLWDFGDGRNSTEQNTTHIYSSPGTSHYLDSNRCIRSQ
ncbi:MAG: FG-GAP-like repeat-containing protein, partial [Euryarchaeota archaeon]|nr:FG-GAP-like repeat-containing protein [Euryarchaeota archaeon]